MDKILQTISKIEVDYQPLESTFSSEIEIRNKKAFDHINLLKLVKVLISEVKQEYQNILVSLGREITDKRKELDDVSKKTKEMTDSFGFKNESNGKLLANQATTIEENDKKIKKQELSIAALNGDISVLNDNTVLLHSSKQGEERELNKIKREVETYTKQKNVLDIEVGNLINEKDLLNVGIRNRTEAVAKLEGEILDKKQKHGLQH
jgi:chromosome segregation ATPase